MDPLVLIIGLTLVLVLVVVARDLWVQHRWRLAAARMNMRFVPGRLFHGDRIYGRRRHRVEIDNRQRKHTSVVVHVDGLPTSLHLAARAWGYPPTDDRLLVGDPRFDGAIRACGPKDEILARLTRRARATLRDIMSAPSVADGASIVVTGGRISYDAEYRVESPTRLQNIVTRLEAIADALTLRASIPDQLLANLSAVDEPQAVRLRNLQVLMTHYPDAAEAAPRTRRAPSPQRAGRRVLRSVLEDRDLPDSLRILALRSAEPDSCLADVVRDPSPAVRAAVARTLAGRDAVESEGLMRLAEDPVADVAAAALQGLARVFERPPPRLHGLLVAALERGPYRVRLAAVEALAVTGRLEAVAKLQLVLRASLFDHRLRQASRNAIRAIQLRAGNGQAGRLSPVVEDGGQLAVSR